MTGISSSGLTLVVRDPKNPPALATELQLLFKAAGLSLPRAAFTNDKQPQDRVIILVGNKP